MAFGSIDTFGCGAGSSTMKTPGPLLEIELSPEVVLDGQPVVPQQVAACEEGRWRR